ncbi:hypothetical protein [Lysobacter gummosus]|uniref:hypothetical protein n=1 Tax=Lysobacter gummosus TaxID=262324 RepID=UPI00362D6A18
MRPGPGRIEPSTRPPPGIGATAARTRRITNPPIVCARAATTGRECRSGSSARQFSSSARRAGWGQIPAPRPGASGGWHRECASRLHLRGIADPDFRPIRLAPVRMRPYNRSDP